MVKVTVNQDLYVEATGESFKKGQTVEVSEKMFEIHGPKGTGFFTKSQDKPKK